MFASHPLLMCPYSSVTCSKGACRQAEAEHAECQKQVRILQEGKVWLADQLKVGGAWLSLQSEHLGESYTV